MNAILKAVLLLKLNKFKVVTRLEANLF